MIAGISRRSSARWAKKEYDESVNVTFVNVSGTQHHRLHHLIEGDFFKHVVHHFCWYALQSQREFVLIFEILLMIPSGASA